MKTKLLIGSVLSIVGLSGCGDDAEGSGTLSVLLEPEDTITSGLDPGEEVENIQDGWQVRFDKYIVAVGEIEVDRLNGGQDHAHDDAVYVVDFTTLPNSGLPLWEVPDLAEGRWDFSFSTPGAGDGAERDDSVEDSDFERMQMEDATYLIDGTLTQTGGRSCPPAALATPGSAEVSGTNAGGDACYENPTIAFSLLANVETSYGPCELDGVPGFSITDGNTQDVAITIHGDHLFFNGFPEGGEGGVTRRAQWLADCDLNLDGEVTRDELEAISISALPAIADYQLGGAPVDPEENPLENMWDYAVAQLKSQGHMNGEGECPPDGMDHAH